MKRIDMAQVCITSAMNEFHDWVGLLRGSGPIIIQDHMEFRAIFYQLRSTHNETG